MRCHFHTRQCTNSSDYGAYQRKKYAESVCSAVVVDVYRYLFNDYSIHKCRYHTYECQPCPYGRDCSKEFQLRESQHKQSANERNQDTNKDEPVIGLRIKPIGY